MTDYSHGLKGDKVVNGSQTVVRGFETKPASLAT